MTTHGMTNTGIHRIWRGIKERCLSPSCPAYERYKDLGICERWMKFENFFEDMGHITDEYGDVPYGLSIERIDNEKGYSPENCKWATRSEQNRNTRRNTLTEEKVVALRNRRKAGVTYKQLAQEFSISPGHAHRVCTGLQWSDV